MRNAIICAGVLLFLLTACGKKEEIKKNIIKPVKYAEVVYSGGIQTKVFNGVSKSGSETKLSFRANGLIVMMRAKVGDRVRKGQLLAKLDQKDISLNYEKAKSALNSAEIQLETAKSNLDRIKQLYQANSASLSDYEQAKNGYANASSGFQTAQKTLALQESQFEYTKITAPTNGVISSKNADINEFAQAGAAIFIMNSEGADLEVRVGIPEKYISKINSGDAVQVVINAQTIAGVISEVGFSTAGTSTYPITIKLVNPASSLRPDMPAEVTFQFGGKEEKNPNLIVPVKAVGEDEQGHFVFLLQPDKSHFLVKKRQVKLGGLSDAGFTILEGLNENDLVATAGLRTLHNDMIVSLLK